MEEAVPKSVEVLERNDGTRLYSVHAGRGPTVLLAHGYLLEHVIYDAVFDALVGEGYRVIAFDQRGHGRSTVGGDGVGPSVLADDYRALLDFYDVHDATLVAHSMGSFLALTFCLEQPSAAKRLARMVVLGGNAGAVAVGSLQNRLQTPLLKAGILKPLWRWDKTGRPLVRSLFGPDAEPGWVETTRQILLRQDTRLTLPMLDAMLYQDLYPRLKEIELETIVLAGEFDRTCPRWHSERLGQDLPNATNVWLANVGHMLTYEAPDEIVRAVRAPSLAAYRTRPAADVVQIGS
jgi:non-heme chloroperoxidase